MWILSVAHLVKVFQTILDMTIIVFAPRLVIFFYAFNARIVFSSDGLATIVLEVFFACVTVLFGRLVVSCTSVINGSLTAVFAQVALLIDKVTNVVSNALLALVNSGVVARGAVFVSVSNTQGTTSCVGGIGVTLLFDVFATLSEVAMSVHQLADMLSHAVEALFSSGRAAVLVEICVARVTFVMDWFSATGLMEVSLAFVVAKVASFLHEVSSVLFDAFETILAFSNFVRAQLLEICCAL